MSSKKIIFGIVTILFLTGCGKTLPRLSEEQKTAIIRTLTEAGQAFQVPVDARKAFLAAPISHPSGRRPPQPNLHNDTMLQESKIRMSQHLQKSFLSGACQDQTADEGNVLLTGARCPIQMRVQAGKQDKRERLHMEYKVKDKEYRKLNDIDSAIIDMSSTTATTEIKAKLHTQKYGDVTISGSFQVNEKNAFSNFQFNFPNFDARLEAQSDERSTNYYLNDEVLTAEQFREYVGGESILNTGSTTPPTTPTS